MRMKVRSILLMAAVALFAAACGDGGNGDTPVATPTPTATPTLTPTPTPTWTPWVHWIPDEPCGEGTALTLTIETLTGGRLDVGWTGSGHGAPAFQGTSATVDMNCPDTESCTLDGSDLAGRALGAPYPLSAAGVSVCVASVFREAVTGTYDACNGCFAMTAKLSARVFLPENADAPCPACVGDPTPNDGRKRGTCRGGATPGAACDVGGVGDVSGTTSHDCLPAGSPLAELAVDLDPLTTATVAAEASVDCLSDAFPPGTCFCRNQVRQNPCEPDGVCPPSGVCESGPLDRVCDDAGSCVEQPRPCFGNHIARTGVCGTEQSELVALFCVPATGDGAIDSTLGLPGPGVVGLPVSQLRTLR